jgi:hypothetical protein
MQTYIHELELSNPFEGIDSIYQLEKFISKSPSYAKPVEHILGHRWEGANLLHQQNVKPDSFVHVSIKQTLVLQWKSCWNAMYNICDAGDFEIDSYFCGSNFQSVRRKIGCSGPQKDCYPLVIQLYYDDFETANPLGSKSGLHKLGGFYFTVDEY